MPQSQLDNHTVLAGYKTSMSLQWFQYGISIDVLDDGYLTPARATNSGLESKKTDAKSVFLRPDSDKAWYGSDPMKVYQSSFTTMYSKLSLRQLKKSLTLAMLATG